MTRDRDQRSPKPPRHVFDKARLAAARRPLQHHGQTRCMRRFKQLDLARDREIIRLFGNSELFDGSFGHEFKFRVSGSEFRVKSSDSSEHETPNPELYPAG